MRLLRLQIAYRMGMAGSEEQAESNNALLIGNMPRPGTLKESERHWVHAKGEMR